MHHWSAWRRSDAAPKLNWPSLPFLTQLTVHCLDTSTQTFFSHLASIDKCTLPINCFSGEGKIGPERKRKNNTVQCLLCVLFQQQKIANVNLQNNFLLCCRLKSNNKMHLKSSFSNRRYILELTGSVSRKRSEPAAKAVLMYTGSSNYFQCCKVSISFPSLLPPPFILPEKEIKQKGEGNKKVQHTILWLPTWVNICFQLAGWAFQQQQQQLLLSTL